MDLLERLMRGVAEAVLGTRCVRYQGRDYDLDAPFRRVSIAAAVLAHNPTLDAAGLRDVATLRTHCERLGIAYQNDDGAGKLQVEIFEKTAEHSLVEPTFVYAYPTEVSPLSRASDADPFLTDRFEFFIAGRELANGFSELNDAEDQAARFQAQAARKRQGDEEAMFYDADYVRALEYGLPPTAGLGIGVDRLVMFLTDAASIRDVLLFPHLRPEA
jgi:lysyl-tRNA synthetase class 2